MQVHVVGGMEMHDLAATGAQGASGTATGLSRTEIGPDSQALQGALSRRHASIVACSPRRNQGLSKT
jgi:hypothetical protein